MVQEAGSVNEGGGVERIPEEFELLRLEVLTLQNRVSVLRSVIADLLGDANREYDEDVFVILDMNQGYTGNLYTFWRKGGHGYTPYLRDIGVFTRAEAKRSVGGMTRKDGIYIVPLAVILDALVCCVDSEKVGMNVIREMAL